MNRKEIGATVKYCMNYFLVVGTSSGRMEDFYQGGQLTREIKGKYQKEKAAAREGTIFSSSPQK